MYHIGSRKLEDEKEVYAKGLTMLSEAFENAILTSTDDQVYFPVPSAEENKAVRQTILSD